ncbi:MAG: S16 family serine protease, partial [Ilumatobacteraceae bacterium]
MPNSTAAIAIAVVTTLVPIKALDTKSSISTDHHSTTVQPHTDAQVDSAASLLVDQFEGRGDDALHGEDPSYPAPDGVADFAGGISARVRHADGTAVDGYLFLLMATAGSDAEARVYDATPFTHDNEIPSNTIESNDAAVATVEAVTGVDISAVELTTAPGGGPSAGITYAIAYLNMLTDGAFTDELRVAATGRMGRHGYVDPINAIIEKTAAARLADADVLFTPVIPSEDAAAAHGARAVGEMFRARHTPAPLAEERRWTIYRTWGATRPDDGMDIVGVRHIGDIAAYLCGAGSEVACTTLELVSVAYAEPQT